MSDFASDKIRHFKRIYNSRLKSLKLSKKETDYFKRNKYRFIYILEKLNNFYHPASKILDIGPTPFTLCLKEIFADSDIIAIDISQIWKEALKSEGICLEVVDLSHGTLPFPAQSFDIIIFTEVIEHLDVSAIRIIQELRRVLKDNGILILSTFNARSLKNIIMPVRRSPVIFYSGNAKVYGHIKEYTLKEITEILKASHFKILEGRYARYFDNLSFYYTSSRLSRYLGNPKDRECFFLARRAIIRIITFPFILGYLILTILIPSFRMGIFFIAEASGVLYED
ncbi:MAG: class I SAM-dependent methyltransferase [Candidatus Omnitrophica bacterium]|nr:class I SAM-dependent methyltransferase [Candidatus Omnitrophota bacterium]